MMEQRRANEMNTAKKKERERERKRKRQRETRRPIEMIKREYTRKKWIRRTKRGVLCPAKQKKIIKVHFIERKRMERIFFIKTECERIHSHWYVPGVFAFVCLVLSTTRLYFENSCTTYTVYLENLQTLSIIIRVCVSMREHPINVFSFSLSPVHIPPWNIKRHEVSVIINNMYFSRQNTARLEETTLSARVSNLWIINKLNNSVKF